MAGDDPGTVYPPPDELTDEIDVLAISPGLSPASGDDTESVDTCTSPVKLELEPLP